MGVVGFNLATTFAWPSVGAGNSAATFTLAASVTGLALVQVRGRLALLLAALTAGCGIFLLALLDAHGSAVLGGLVIGVLAGAISPPGIIPPPPPAPRGWMPGELPRPRPDGSGGSAVPLPGLTTNGAADLRAQPESRADHAP